jgi:CubicO group peptidase (beta-lactamase class C family)
MRADHDAVHVAVEGKCDSRPQRVRDAFAENFALHDEVGATVAITVDGRLAVDLWAGHADAARTRPWARDTIVAIASSTKGLTALCAHRLVDRGLRDLCFARSTRGRGLQSLGS